MMTNIHGLKFFLCYFFITTTWCRDILEIRLSNLCPENLQFLQEASKRYPQNALHIMVVPNAPFKMELIPEPSWWNQLAGPKEKSDFLNFFTLGKAGYYGLQFVVGSGVLSYCTIFYCIYRSYKIAKKVYDMAQWFNGEKEQPSDSLETIKSMLYRKKIITKPRITKEALKILRDYAILNAFLKKINLRWLFPFDATLEKYIKEELLD